MGVVPVGVYDEMRYCEAVEMMVEYNFAEVIEEVREDTAYAVDGTVRMKGIAKDAQGTLKTEGKVWYTELSDKDKQTTKNLQYKQPLLVKNIDDSSLTFQ